MAMAAKAKGAKGAKGGQGGRTNARPLVIRKEEIIEGGHHGGAWKVAYADFVTAMMAFFLLMWLINATTTAQRIGLADYFSQANVLNRGASGEGKPFGGSDPFDSGALASNLGTIQIMPGRHQPQSIHPQIQPAPRVAQSMDGARTPGAQGAPVQAPGAQSAPVQAPGAQSAPAQNAASSHAANRAVLNDAMQQADEKAEDAALRDAAQQMRNEIDSDRNLAAYDGQISITVTPDGMKIQIIDSHDRPMFMLGSATPTAATEAILSKIAPILGKLAHPISIAGYTDARPYTNPTQSNWLLSVERANATRAVLVGNGLPENDLAQVAGYADRQLLHPEDPLAAANRRITITIAKDPTPSFGPTQ